MLSILVAHSYFLRFDRKQVERAKPYPPLATLQVASMLRRSGHAVEVFDAMLADSVAEYEQQLHRLRPQLLLLYEDSFNFLSKMCLERMRRASCEMIALARGCGARVLAVGSDATDAPGPYLDAGAEAVLVGEGLPPLRALTARLDADPQLPLTQLVEGLSAVVTSLPGTREFARSAALTVDANGMQEPAWDLVDIERYRAVWKRAHGYFSLNMAASRGCSFRCNWCSKPIWGNKYLQRAPRDVAAEMTELKRRFAPDHVWFADDIFGFRTDWITEFTQALTAADGMIPFTIQTRADLISGAMARVLRQAGCAEAWLGAESGSQKILNAMNKGITVPEILTARARLKAEGIRVGFFIQIGYLGEQLDDILATRELIERAQPDEVGVSVSYPLPGTPFYEQVKAQLGDKNRWQDSNDLEMMFHGTYASEFYRAVRELLHDQVEAQRLQGPDQGAERRWAAQSLQRRWDGLIVREPQLRRDTADFTRGKIVAV
ncbi:MAG TPA: radical SAM protein [Steroidobacteraceae bacterium]|jgi:anaerobic magnesium-protoporphyrin IX monomethyl ester cyclase